MTAHRGIAAGNEARTTPRRPAEPTRVLTCAVNATSAAERLPTPANAHQDQPRTAPGLQHESDASSQPAPRAAPRSP